MKKSGSVWLIDAAYVLKGHEGNIDYINIRNTLQNWVMPEGGRFDRIVFYNSYDENTGRADEFHDMLKRNGFELSLFPLSTKTTTCKTCQSIHTVSIQKGVDVSLCTDMLCMAFEGKFKNVVITGGDKDFIPAIKVVKSMFRNVYITGYRNSMSSELKNLSDGIFWMNK